MLLNCRIVRKTWYIYTMEYYTAIIIIIIIIIIMIMTS